MPKRCGDVPTYLSEHYSQMEDREIIFAIGWLLVASGALAVMLSSLSKRHGYRATTVGLLAVLGLLIAGPIWAAVVVLGLTLARFGYYLYFLTEGRHGKKEHHE
jgi:hypothetical protein